MGADVTDCCRCNLRNLSCQEPIDSGLRRIEADTLQCKKTIDTTQRQPLRKATNVGSFSKEIATDRHPSLLYNKSLCYGAVYNAATCSEDNPVITVTPPMRACDLHEFRVLDRHSAYIET